jgi:hypothetical protein
VLELTRTLYSALEEERVSVVVMVTVALKARLPFEIQFHVAVGQTRQCGVLETQLPVLGDGGCCFGLEFLLCCCGSLSVSERMVVR